jgi:hypothetical protein
LEPNHTSVCVSGLSAFSLPFSEEATDWKESHLSAHFNPAFRIAPRQEARIEPSTVQAVGIKEPPSKRGGTFKFVERDIPKGFQSISPG